MDTAGTGVRRDMIAQDDQRFPIIERMLTGDLLQLAAFICLKDRLFLEAELLPERIDHLRQHDEFSLFALYQRIGKVFVEADGEVGRDRPWRRRPDDKARITLQDALSILYREGDIDRRALDVMILDLCLRQCRLGRRRPVDRLEPLVDQAVHRHLAEDLDLLRLKLLIQRDVRMIVIPYAA